MEDLRGMVILFAKHCITNYISTLGSDGELILVDYDGESVDIGDVYDEFIKNN